MKPARVRPSERPSRSPAGNPTGGRIAAWTRRARPRRPSSTRTPPLSRGAVAPRPAPAAARPLHRPRAVLARVQPPRARPRRGRAAADPRALELPRDLRVEPRRVLHGAGRRPEAPHPHRSSRCRRTSAARRRRCSPTSTPPRTCCRCSTRRCSTSRSARCSSRPGIRIVGVDDLPESERNRLADVFANQIFPVLMPLAVDPAHPFPYISGLSLNLAVRVRNPKSGRVDFARLKVPTGSLPRLVATTSPNSSTATFVLLEDLIAHHLDELFPGMEVLEHHVFRLTRNEDLEVDEDESENLIQALEKELLRRRFGPPIRLEITEDMDATTLELLTSELDVTRDEVYRLPGPLDLAGLFELNRLDRPQLHYPTAVPATAPAFVSPEPNEKPDLFTAIAEQDVLVHHPYESFATSVQAFLEQAAADPDVLAIKQTLYRTSGDSPIVEALIDAAEAGKQVLALVEIKARFDEQNNIDWARKLERAGVHVVYGLVGLEDALQARARRPPRGRRQPEELLPHRHGQLQPEDQPHLRGLRPVHRGRAGREGPHPAVQRAVRLRDREEVPSSARRAAAAAQGAAEAHQRGAHARGGRQARPHPHQGELDGRRGDHRRPLPRQPGGRRGAGLGPRHLQPEAGHPGHQRQHHRAVDPRPLPRALADLLVPERRRPGHLHRQRRHDAPQPRPAGGGARPAEALRSTSPRWTGCSTRR